MTQILHNNIIKVSFTGPCPEWAKEWLTDPSCTVQEVAFGDYTEGEDVSEWDTTTGKRKKEKPVPPTPPEVLLQQEEQELLGYLRETDWYAVRLAEGGEYIPSDIKIKRQEARKRISEIREIPEVIKLKADQAKSMQIMRSTP